MTTLSAGAWYRTLFARSAYMHMERAHAALFDPDCPTCGQMMRVVTFSKTLTDEELESVIAQG